MTTRKTCKKPKESEETTREGVERRRFFQGLLVALGDDLPDMPPLAPVTGKIVELVLDKPPRNRGSK